VKLLAGIVLVVSLLLPTAVAAQPAPVPAPAATAPAPAPTGTTTETLSQPPPPSPAPSSADLRCAAALKKRSGEDASRGACKLLANVVLEGMETKVGATSAEVAPPMPEAVGAQGSAGEVAVVPSVAPTPAAGATVALAGTEAGPRLVTALGLNPGALAASDAETYAVQSRFSDVAVVFPTKLGDSDGNSFEYVGIRARLNFVAPWSGASAYEAAQREAVKRYKALGEEQSMVFDDYVNKLTQSSDPNACAAALVGREADAIESACGSPPLASELEQREAAAHQALEAVRLATDKNYLGLDLRANFGDYTSAGTREARKAFGLVAATGAAIRIFHSRLADISLRARVGAVYAHLRDLNEFALDWGLAVELAGTSPTSKLRLSAGLEGHKGKSDVDESFDLNYTDVKLALAVPTGDGSNLGVGISLPARGDHGVTLTTAGDLATFLPR
jgi:hypothetical protein